MLIAVIDKLEDAPVEDRKHYKKIDLADGTVEYHADIKGAKGVELQNVAGLLSTVEKLRQKEQALTKYGTVTPEEATASVARVAELTTQVEALKKGKNGDVEERIKQVEAELKRVHAEELVKERNRSESRRKALDKVLRDDAAAQALMEVGFKSANKLMRAALIPDIDVVEDDNGNFATVVRGPGGVERIVAEKDGSTRRMTPLDRARELASSEEFRPYLDVKTETKPTQQPTQRQRAPAAPISDELPRPYNATEAIADAFANAPRK